MRSLSTELKYPIIDRLRKHSPKIQLTKKSTEEDPLDDRQATKLDKFATSFKNTAIETR